MTTSTEPDRPRRRRFRRTRRCSNYYPTPEDPERVRFVRELFDKSAEHYDTVELHVRERRPRVPPLLALARGHAPRHEGASTSRPAPARWCAAR